jgi:hypothetical protein
VRGADAVIMSVSADQRDFCSGFDSRQLHREYAGQSFNISDQFPFQQYLINICRLCRRYGIAP